MDQQSPLTPPPEEATDSLIEAYDSHLSSEEIQNSFKPADPPPPSGMKTLYLSLTIAITFILGLTIGFFGRPALIKDLPIEVIVTVIPNEAEQDSQTHTVTDETNSSAKVDMTKIITPEDNLESGTESETMPTPTIMDFVLSDARHFQGNKAAPITIVEFSDFNCGFCGRFATTSLDQLRDVYVETGKAQFIYKHFAILGPDSNRAAEASECAADQDEFWEFHDTLFTNRVSGQADLSENSLIAQAVDIGLDKDQFTDCLTSGKYSSQIQQETLTVQSMGMRGTPGFLINGVFLSGAQPFEVFEEIIEEQLAKLE